MANGITGTQFWTEFLTILEGGQRTSDVDYYLPNKPGADQREAGTARPGEWAHVIDVTFQRTEPNSPERRRLIELLSQAGFWAPGDNLEWWVGQDLNELDLNDLRVAAEARFPTMFSPEDAPTGIGSQGDGGTGRDPGSLNDPTLGAGGPPQGVMRGMQLTKILMDDGREIWGLTGEVGGVQHVYTFDSFQAMQQALGEDAVTSGRYGFLQLPESEVNDGNTWILGDAAAFVGQAGDYNGWFNNTMNEAALEAGIRNPGMVGQYLADPEVQRIIAMGEAGDWSNERIQAELRRTTFYNETLYPGIDNYLRAGDPNPEATYLQYLQDVDKSLEDLGYERGPDGTYRHMMDDMLSRGIEADEFNTFAPSFVRAEQSQDFAEALSFWTQQEMGRDLTFEDWLDVLAGTSSAEMEGIVERAQLQFQAEQQLSTTLEPDQLSRLAEMTGLSEQQMAAAFTSAEEALLSLGNAGLERYGLTEQALVNAAFNIRTPGADIREFRSEGPAGPGGISEGMLGGVVVGQEPDLTPEEVRRRARKTLIELGVADDPKQQFFVGFTERGTLERPGLRALAGEAG